MDLKPGDKFGDRYQLISKPSAIVAPAYR